MAFEVGHGSYGLLPPVSYTHLDVYKRQALAIAKYYREVIFTDMNQLREIIDALEVLVPSDIWPYPTYGEILYSVK